jgi:predicted component of type VI protein secretion system
VDYVNERYKDVDGATDAKSKNSPPARRKAGWRAVTDTESAEVKTQAFLLARLRLRLVHEKH